jgi:hypothetical protein
MLNPERCVHCGVRSGRVHCGQSPQRHLLGHDRRLHGRRDRLDCKRSGYSDKRLVNLSYTQVVNNTSGGDLFFNATGFGYTMPVGPDMTLFGSQATSTNSVSSGGTVTSQLYADPTGLGLFSNLISCSYAVTTSSSCDAPTTTWNRGANPTFSLTDVVIFDLGLGQGVNGSSNVTASQIPEPVSTALVGLGLVGLGLFSRRRQLKA